MSLAFFIMFLWYIMQPVTMKIITTTYAVAENMGYNNTYLNSGITILTWIEYWWGPIFLLAIAVVWMFIVSHRREWESRYAEQ